jgi:type I restriction enzyme R subunit
VVDISERNFEATIESLLLAGGPDDPEPSRSLRERSVVPGPYVAGGYHKRSPEAYDKSLCLISKDVLDFILITQPKEWEKLKRNAPNETETHFLTRLSEEIRKYGTLHVLRNGVKSLGCKFDLTYFEPVTGLNPEIQRLYQGNIFSIVRQLKYSEKNENSLDTVIFLNGLPIFTVELKNPLTGQSVQNAIRQYRQDRDPRETLFAFRRCLAHFAVDPDLVYFTTKLEGTGTRFIPFNRGSGNGAGNAHSWEGFSTAYLWEQVWDEYEEEDDEGKKTGKRVLIFPRYHQLDSVRRLTTSAREKGTGQRYLVQHSAGSGKSNSIAWLAHQLSVLHDRDDKPIFDSVVVITDRLILDRQLRRTVLSFEQTAGMVQPIT